MRTDISLALTLAAAALSFAGAAAASPASFMPQRNLQADLAKHIATCDPFGELFSNPYTGDSLWREIEGVVDGRCVYSEDVPGNMRMNCRYEMDRLPRIADLYANPEKYEDLSIRMQSHLEDGELVTVTSYSRDGEPVDYPLADVFETGECTTDRLGDDALSRIPAGTVYGEPYAKAPDGFKPHELPFEIKPNEVARAEDVSAEFWAVVLRTDAPCTILEDERAELQTYFQQNRVFMTRFGCDDEFGADEFVTYNGVEPDQAFLAIYAGTRREHADWLMGLSMLQSRYGAESMRVTQLRAVMVYP